VFLTVFFKTFPIAYVLMTSRKQSLYEKVFDCVIASAEEYAGRKPNPELAMSDYETGLLNAMSSRFPGARVRGCWFHYAQVLSGFYCNWSLFGTLLLN
jgi:hypothetical protein